jgi:hypothetical protein
VEGGKGCGFWIGGVAEGWVGGGTEGCVVWGGGRAGECGFLVGGGAGF